MHAFIYIIGLDDFQYKSDYIYMHKPYKIVSRAIEYSFAAPRT